MVEKMSIPYILNNHILMNQICSIMSGEDVGVRAERGSRMTVRIRSKFSHENPGRASLAHMACKDFGSIFTRSSLKFKTKLHSVCLSMKSYLKDQIVIGH